MITPDHNPVAGSDQKIATEHAGGSGLEQARGLREYYDSLPTKDRINGKGLIKQIGEAGRKYSLLCRWRATERLRVKAIRNMRRLDDYFRVENRGQE